VNPPPFQCRLACRTFSAKATPSPDASCHLEEKPSSPPPAHLMTAFLPPPTIVVRHFCPFKHGFSCIVGPLSGQTSATRLSSFFCGALRGYSFPPHRLPIFRSLIDIQSFLGPPPLPPDQAPSTLPLVSQRSVRRLPFHAMQSSFPSSPRRVSFRRLLPLFERGKQHESSEPLKPFCSGT